MLPHHLENIHLIHNILLDDMSKYSSKIILEKIPRIIILIQNFKRTLHPHLLTSS